jgi:hypothetical protein
MQMAIIMAEILAMLSLIGDFCELSDKLAGGIGGM